MDFLPQTPLGWGNVGVNMILNSLFPGAGLVGSLVEGPLEQALGLVGGAPKQGGYAEVGPEAGTLTQLYGGTGTDRGYTPNQADPYIQQYLGNLDAQYNADLKSFGLQADPATFALGYDTDPGGTAPDRYTGGVDVNGKLIDTAKDVSGGRDPNAFNAAVGTYGNKMLDDALAAAGATPQQIASLSATGGAPTVTGGSGPQGSGSLLNIILSGLGSIPGLAGMFSGTGAGGTGTGGTGTGPGGTGMAAGDGTGTGTGGSNLGTDIGSLISLWQAFSGQAGKNANQVAGIADPLMQYQQGFASQFNNFMQDPSSVLQDPAFQAALGLGEQGVARTLGAQGMGGSGNIDAALMNYGQAAGLGYEQQRFNQLLSSVSPATGTGNAANTILQGQQNQANNMAGGLTGAANMIAQALGLSPAASGGIVQMLQRAFGGGGSGGLSATGGGQMGDAGGGGDTPIDWGSGSGTPWTSGFDISAGGDLSGAGGDLGSLWTSGFDLGGG